MPKNIIFESFKHQLLTSARVLASGQHDLFPADPSEFETFITELEFEQVDSSNARIRWKEPTSGQMVCKFKGPIEYYFRGDNERGNQLQEERKLKFGDEDPLQSGNAKVFEKNLLELCNAAGVQLIPRVDSAKAESLKNEEDFHDNWAAGEDVEKIDVIQANTAITAPEMRYITKALGDIRGKTLLDIGCGLGEASVFFATQGAEVTASDLSGTMLEVTSKVAAKYGVEVATLKSSAESLNVPAGQKFDIVYVGNLLHHVDVKAALKQAKQVLNPGGRFVSWDPLAYNPLINVYRRIATQVRTEDEHPLTLADLKEFRRNFKRCEFKYFWFFTLLVFVWIAAFNNPNKTRFWKEVVWNADRYSWLYRPLKFVDDILLTLLPFLGPLCWNVVVIASEPIDD